jgi:Rieske Fe-S protein
MNRAIQSAPPPSRRDFIEGIFASIIGAILGLVPLGAGLVVLLDPLRRRASESGAVRVASLEAVPADGVPRKFPVLATRVDAWNKYSQVPIGAVYLRRTPEGKLLALNVVCPHAGCFVDFLAESGHFHCPCHNSSFAVTGKIDDPTSPAPRGMDTLEAEVRNGKEIWVKFENFQAGRAEKVPVA